MKHAGVIKKIKENTDLIIEKIGSWLWVIGQELTNKEKGLLKALGFKYSRNKNAFYLGSYKANSIKGCLINHKNCDLFLNRSFSLQDIRGFYKTQKI